MSRRIVFITGTRADFGKMKSLMLEVEKSESFECHVFITGMHTLKTYGDTRIEVIESGFRNVQVFMNQIPEEPMDLVLANTINGFSRYIKELNPDLIITHGDRVETLAAAIVGALNNIRVGHVEGGEVSGTIDDSIRHAVSKLSHLHFVSNETARDRLLQLGESSGSIFVIGSPDLDLFRRPVSVDLQAIKSRYGIPFDQYGIVLFHPVTTELAQITEHAKALCQALESSGDNYIVIFPNNDLGSKAIFDQYERLKQNPKIKLIPSIRFEFFVEIMRNGQYLLGNSSAGIHEAPYLGLPSVNIGTRQYRRFSYASIINCGYSTVEILSAIDQAKAMKHVKRSDFFGDGNSHSKFLKVLLEESTWKIHTQKTFFDWTQPL